MVNIDPYMAIKLAVGFLLLATGSYLGWRYADDHMKRGWELGTLLRLRDSVTLLAIVILTGISLCGFFILRIDPGVLWDFPEGVELYHQDFFQAVFLLEAAFLCIAVSRIALRSSAQGAFLSLFVLGGFVAYLAALDRPIAPSLHNSVQNGVVMQTSGYSCAAASLANVLNVLGRRTTEPEAAALLRTTRIGTISAEILVQARRLGFQAQRFRMDESNWERVPVPSIIFVDQPEAGREGHAVCLMRIGADRFEIWDPLVGRVLYNRSALADIWHGRGIHIWRQEGQ